MTEVFSFEEGVSPLLVSIPHDGRQLAPGMAERMTGLALGLPDTDWHVNELYSFARDLGASVLSANYSRYVVDLNRSAADDALYDNRFSTSLCPLRTFSGADIYIRGESCDDAEKAARTQSYWHPYHRKLDHELRRIRDSFGYALLWDAHSIPGQVPLLFEGLLADLNLGTNDGASCNPGLQDRVSRLAVGAAYSTVVNGRFKGGHITRHYGNPGAGVHAIQLELAQRCYMDELSRDYHSQLADRLADVLDTLLRGFLAAAKQLSR